MGANTNAAENAAHAASTAAAVERKIAEARHLLAALGMDQERSNRRSALVLLALCRLAPNDNWTAAENPPLTLSQIMAWIDDVYGVGYAPSTRETIRRFTLRQFAQGGLVIENADDFTRPLNSPRWNYSIAPAALEAVRGFGRGEKPAPPTRDAPLEGDGNGSVAQTTSEHRPFAEHVRSDVSEAVADTVSHGRQRLGLTQGQLAERSGVSLYSVRRIESGDADGTSLGTVARVLGECGYTLRPQLGLPAAPRDDSAVEPSALPESLLSRDRRPDDIPRPPRARRNMARGRDEDNVSIVLLGGKVAGRLGQHATGKLWFAYDESYAGPDLSVLMPKGTDERFEGEYVYAWFAGVLPDSKRVREEMARECGCSPESVFKLLGRYGLDLPGAVQVVSTQTRELLGVRESAYVEVSDAVVADRLARLIEADEAEQAGARPVRGGWATRDEHWSLGGNQSKLALMEHEGRWYECRGSAASNVIVKPGVFGYRGQALNECVCMRLAHYVGLVASTTEIRSFDGVPALVARRYDRVTRVDRGRVAVDRVHQEDCCQALGIRPTNKYPFEGGPTSGDVIRLLDGAIGDATYDFVDALVFNYLIGGTDAHAKNYSLLHLEGSTYALAPLYDVASMLPYVERHGTYRTAMAIGRENRLGWLRESSLRRMSKVHDISLEYLTQRTIQLADRVVAELPHALDDFASFDGTEALAEVLVPRVTNLCVGTKDNVGRSGGRMVPVRLWQPPAP